MIRNRWSRRRSVQAWGRPIKPGVLVEICDQKKTIESTAARIVSKKKEKNIQSPRVPRPFFFRGFEAGREGGGGTMGAGTSWASFSIFIRFAGPGRRFDDNFPLQALRLDVCGSQSLFEFFRRLEAILGADRHGLLDGIGQPAGDFRVALSHRRQIDIIHGARQTVFGNNTGQRRHRGWRRENRHQCAGQYGPCHTARVGNNRESWHVPRWWLPGCL